MRIHQSYLAATTAMLLATSVSAGPLGLESHGALGGSVSGVGSVGAIGFGNAGINSGIGDDLSGRIDSRTSAIGERAGTTTERARSRADDMASRVHNAADSLPLSVDAASAVSAGAAGAATLGANNAAGATDGESALAGGISQPRVEFGNGVMPAGLEANPSAVSATSSSLNTARESGEAGTSPDQTQPAPAKSVGAGASGGAAADGQVTGPAANSARAGGSANASANASVAR